MKSNGLSAKKALILFVGLVLFAIAQAVWWVIFMARLVGEKKEIMQSFNADPALFKELEAELFRQQVMIGLEGTVFIILILIGIWLIYNSLVRSEELKFHQQNFLLAVTHELKTPLASIKVYMDSLTSSKISGQNKAAIVPRMQQDVSRLEKLVENILEAGRFEKSGYHLLSETLNLTKLVSDSLDNFKRQYPTLQISILRELEQDLLILGDAAALDRAIDAICENAVKYHNGGGIEIRVTLVGHGGKILLRISDNGIGFERKECTAIFGRFYRVGDELTRRSEGSGLGLFLCREILNAHGAAIRAASEGPGKGASFEITFNRQKVNENDTAGRG